ncbi:MAG: hypothetical protein JWP63_85 [Candidatus Solibacter sp.]|jgi:hypothetical protein|nr:hypothetical protein [Candidatus Solibacter sp.]
MIFGSAFSLALLAFAPLVSANPVLDPGGPGGLTLFNVSNLASFNDANPTGLYEGIAITSNTLYLSLGDPTSLTQSVWALPLIRSNGHIVSVESSGAILYKSLPNNLGDTLGGGLVTVNGGILYTMLPTFLGQAVGAPTLTDLGIAASIGGLQYVPGSGNSQLKVSSTSGDWYTANVSGTPGSYTVGSVSQQSLGVAAYSFDYIPADLTFATAGMILGDASSISYYQVDNSGAPKPGTRVQLVNYNFEAAIGYGVARDPFSGDVLFTTGDNQIFRLSDTYDAPEPSTVLLALGGIALLATRARRR